LFLANLEQANLEGANLRLANLSITNFAGANLHRANLEAANLEGTNFSDAFIEDANFHAVFVSDEGKKRLQQRGAIGLEKTISIDVLASEKESAYLTLPNTSSSSSPLQELFGS